jgi:glycosyltransferase involved in cell wall biosynthesis
LPRWTLPDDISVGPLRIGFFASAHRSKGLHILLQAVAALPTGSVHLHVHGPAEGADEPHQSFHGPYRADELEALMDGLDLVALPSTWDENQPMVALEARAFGKPLLVSDAGGLPELVEDGVDGWVLPAGRTEDWAERLAILASNRQDTREAGLRARPPQSARGMAAAYLQAYREALSKETLANALTEAHPVEDNVSSRS